MAYDKINTVTNANLAKVNSLVKANIGKIDNIDAPASWTNSYSIDFDGTNDYMTADGIFNDISVSAGTVSMWIKLDSTSLNGVLIKADVDTNNQLGMAYLNSTTKMRFQYKAGGTNKK